MEIMRIRTLWKGTESSLMCFWKNLIDLGHQRFKIEDTGEVESAWVDLFLPELLKYGIPKNSQINLNRYSFLWPWPKEAPLLRPVFYIKVSNREISMFLDVNYYGIYYDRESSKFRGRKPKNGVDADYKDRLRHTKILRDLGIPFDFFNDNQKYWPVIDLDRPNDRYEYYFQRTSEV